MVMFVSSLASTLHATSKSSARSMYDALISPLPFHVPLATYVLPSLIVLVNVPWKSNTDASPSLSKVPFSVNVAWPVPCMIRVSSVLNEPLVVTKVTSSEVSWMLRNTSVVSTIGSPLNNSSPNHVSCPEIPLLSTAISIFSVTATLLLACSPVTLY